MISEDEFLKQLQQAIDTNKIQLPTLPEVALKVRDAIGQENANAQTIAEMVATDAALSTRLLQVANSPLYRGRVAIDSIKMAITRLGNKLVRSLVLSLAMKQIFQSTSAVLDKKLRDTWEYNVDVAAICRVIAQSLPHLDKEQAMLAGLIHNIGTLPILTMAETIPELASDAALLDQFADNLNSQIGKQILEAWDFPQTLVAIPENYQNLDYDGGELADYVDVVLVGRLQILDNSHPAANVDWSEVASFRKVGIEPEIELITIEDIAENMDDIKTAFL